MSILALLAALLQVAPPVAVSALRTEYDANPLGIDARRPRLSWRLESARRGERQTAYRILAASSEAALRADRGDVWDSGKVASDQSVHVSYAGRALRSRERVFWKVRAWDRDGRPSAWSEAARFEMGLLERADWSAQWIALPGGAPAVRPSPVPAGQLASLPSLPSPHLRKTFELAKPVRRARVYATARGLYDLYLNGARVGDDYFRPGWTDYRKRIQYQVYDVTGRLLRGRNAVGVRLGEGWYRGHLGMWQNGQYGETLQALLQLEVEHDDGSTTRVVTDGSWLGRTGGVKSSDLLMGEHYDARQAPGAWDAAAYDASGWSGVAATPLDATPLVAQIGPSVRRLEELRPKSVSQRGSGAFVFDLGQNLVGWARLRVEGPAGTTVTLRFAEILNPDGSIYTTNLRRAKATDSYTLAGTGVETWEPSFTFHGFRYVEVAGYPGTPGPEAITGIALSSAWPEAGRFESSHPLVNQLQKNIVWGLRGNFLEVPTDCPQRDERLGWMGDIQVFAPTALYNVHASRFLEKWMWDVVDAQKPEGSFADFSPRVTQWTGDGAPAWADAGVIVPWTMYVHTGDTRVLETHWDAMARYVDFIHSENIDLLWTRRTGNNYGDWLNIHADTPREVLATAYFANSAALVAKSARVLGKPQAAEKYEQLAREIRAAFQKAYVRGEGLGFRVRGDTQTGYLLALRFGLLDPKQAPWAVERLGDDIVFARKNHLSTGFLGVGMIAPVLSDHGKSELAYTLLMNDTFPSWGFSIRQGATTIWERWDGWTPEKGFQDAGMNSFNHYALGSVGEWLYSTVAGIAPDPERPGFKHVLMAPRPGGGLSAASASHETPYGILESAWTQDGDRFDWTVTLPANTSATVRVPAKPEQTVSEGGQPASIARRDKDAATVEIGSGSYRFSVR
jgi:alpha-L-rhamnosidase